jgi:hypothetical protein
VSKPLFAALIGVSALAIPAASAHAQASMDVLCSPRPNAIPCVRDANNKIVGLSLLYYVSRQIKADWYAISVTEDGLVAGGTFYYAGPNCTGQAYIYDAGYLPRLALYDGQAIFTADRIGGDGFDWQSYSSPAKVNRGGKCTDWPYCFEDGKPCHAQFGGPAIKIETVTFSGDFKVR